MYGKPLKGVAYGTAGFRDDARFLPPILYRVGMLASLRSRFLNGKSIGVMVTASHNPPGDNGAKLIDPMGEMLAESWEAYANELAVCEDADEFIRKLGEQLGVNPNSPASVIYGKDTRASGPKLVEALQDGIERSRASAQNFGTVTTPQLHYLVRSLNTLVDPELESYGVPSIEGYYLSCSRAFKATLRELKVRFSVTVDCANGVGAPKLAELQNYVDSIISFNLINAENDPDMLNVDCGADFVKVQQRLPANASPEPNQLFASFDGDADRIVFYFISEDGSFHLLDGDKIATLLAEFLQKTGLDVGVVQTAYANGASTDYLKDMLQLPVVCTPTGVKHLHQAAHQFDAGIYFEANGHGTVLFTPDAKSKFQTRQVANQAEKHQVDALLAFMELINQTTGDAITDLLAVIAVLTCEHLGPVEWDERYSDLPNRLLKSGVKDRFMFRTTDAERRLLEPKGLQGKIDSLVKQYKRGRSFVRASGTENVVRVYAEAATQEAADSLASGVLELLKAYA